MSGRRTIGSLLVKLGFDPKEVDAGIKKFEKNLKDAGRRMESIGKQMSIGFTAPFVLGMRQAIKAYDEEAQVVKKLEVALGRTSKALLDQAALIQKTTIYSDDAVITQQAWAAALGHSEEEIKKMTTAAVGLASGLGIGLDQAMSMLHKSTLGAAKGLGNLVPGVKEMTAEQLKSGAAIDLVNQKFAGFAEAAAKAGTGPLKQFENRFGDLMEQFGEQALPLLNSVIAKFEKLTEWFSKLSPETKKMVVEFGAFVALAGPVMLMVGNLIKLTQTVIGLSTAIKGLAAAGGGIIAIAAAVATISKFYKDATGLTLNPATLGLEGLLFKNKGGGGATASARYEGLRSGMTMSDLIPNLSMIPSATATTTGGGGGGGGAASGKGSYRGLDWMTRMLSPNRGGNGMGNIKPGDTSTMFGGTPIGALQPMGDVAARSGMFNILPDMTAQLQVQEDALAGYKSAWMETGSIMTNVLSGMAADLKSGMPFFAAFGKAALSAAAQVAKAALVQTASNLIASSSKAGIPGLVIGFAAAIAAVSAIEGLIGGIKAPQLARGGLAYGPSHAVIGDNPNAHIDPELVIPMSKLRKELGGNSGGGGGMVRVVGVIRGDDIHLQTMRAQDRAIRRGSGNVITF